MRGANSLYIVKQRKSENFFDEKNVKITKGSHAYEVMQVLTMLKF